MNLAENIVNLRKNRNLTQAQLAETLNMTSAAVSKWETGVAVPDLDTLVALADYFRVPMDDLLGRTLERPRVVLFAPEKEVERTALRLLKDYNYQVLGVGHSLEEMEELLIRLKEQGEHTDKIIMELVEYETSQVLVKLSELNNRYGCGGLAGSSSTSLKKMERNLRNMLDPD